MGIDGFSSASAVTPTFRTVPDIPRSMFKDHASLKGKVITVSDGDSIRVRPNKTKREKNAERVYVFMYPKQKIRFTVVHLASFAAFVQL